MSNFELISFTSDEELARAAASQWSDEIQFAKRKGAKYFVALPGGRIIRKLFSATAELAKEHRGILDSVHFFWGDERCVPSDDAESNFKIARELLLEPLKVPESRIHRIRGEEEPQTAAQEAEAGICRRAPLDSDGQPMLDLVLLGMGEDGHVASLFPGEPDEVIASAAVYRAVTATKPPPRRITLGYSTIAAARQVWVLASGAGKENALNESLASSGKTPLARVLRLRSATRIFTDIQISKKFRPLG
jgi:6-phosphogluconolactonase